MVWTRRQDAGGASVDGAAHGCKGENVLSPYPASLLNKPPPPPFCMQIQYKTRYNQSEADFSTPEEYDNYLETVEDIGELLLRVFEFS